MTKTLNIYFDGRKKTQDVQVNDSADNLIYPSTVHTRSQLRYLVETTDQVAIHGTADCLADVYRTLHDDDDN